MSAGDHRADIIQAAIENTKDKRSQAEATEALVGSQATDDPGGHPPAEVVGEPMRDRPPPFLS